MMGRRGPAPKPTALKVLEGNPGKRALPVGEPRPRPTAPSCPDWLSEDAKAEWQRHAPELERLGLLTILDGAPLAAAMEAIAELKKANEVIERDGMTCVGSNGALYQHPAVGIRHKAMQLIRAFAAEYGFTPAARVRLATGKPDEDETWGGILS